MNQLTDNEIHERLNALIQRRTKGIRFINTKKITNWNQYEVADVQ